MKVFIQKGTKRFVAGMLMAFLFVLFPSALNFVVNSVRVSYYSHLPIEDILSSVSIQFENLCLGENEQVWLGTRTVGLKDGISANVTRELYKLIETQERGQIQAKIYEETGEYVWQLKMNELRLPGGVIRTDLPIIRTNIFEVKDCTYDPI